MVESTYGFQAEYLALQTSAGRKGLVARGVERVLEATARLRRTMAESTFYVSGIKAISTKEHTSNRSIITMPIGTTGSRSNGRYLRLSSFAQARVA